MLILVSYSEVTLNLILSTKTVSNPKETLAFGFAKYL